VIQKGTNINGFDIYLFLLWMFYFKHDVYTIQICRQMILCSYVLQVSIINRSQRE